MSRVEPDTHTLALSALAELLYPEGALSPHGIAGRLDLANPSARKLLDAVAELRERHPHVREDGREWWPVVGALDVQRMLEWVAALGADPWGAALVNDRESRDENDLVPLGGRWRIASAGGASS